MEEPTLEMLTRDYDVISFKHCFSVSSIQPDRGAGDVAAEEKRLENYVLQYEALKAKLHEFPDTRFVVWTAAALVAAGTDEGQAERTRLFVEWVKTEWNEPGDNIFVWDFHGLGYRDIRRESAGNCPGQIFRWYWRIDLNQTNLPQRAHTGISSARSEQSYL